MAAGQQYDDRLIRIREEAKRELDEEDFRAEVERAKEKMRNQRGFWVRVFPWRIIIVRKGV